MIRVTIELIPHGLESEAEHLHTIEIANDGSGTPERGVYKARVGRRGVRSVFIKPWREKVLAGFPRRSKNAVHLLARVLKNLGYS